MARHWMAGGVVAVACTTSNSMATRVSMMGVAQGNQLTGFLGGHDAGHSAQPQHIAFGGLRVLDQVQGVLRAFGCARPHCLAVRERFGPGDLDHVGIALGVKVGQGRSLRLRGCSWWCPRSQSIIRGGQPVCRVMSVPYSLRSAPSICGSPCGSTFKHKPYALRLLPGM